jgi:hypothetical protein
MSRRRDRARGKRGRPADAAAARSRPADAPATRGRPADAPATRGRPADAAAARGRPANAPASQDRPAGAAPPGPGGAAAGLPARLALLAAVFAVTVGIAEIAGAANLGVSFGIGQIAFAIALLVLLIRA